MLKFFETIKINFFPLWAQRYHRRDANNCLLELFSTCGWRHKVYILTSRVRDFREDWLIETLHRAEITTSWIKNNK